MKLYLEYPMNSAALSLIVSSSSLVQSQYPNSLCAIAECWIVQYRRGEQDIFYPVRVRAWGANADALSQVAPNSKLVAIGGLWLFENQTVLEVSSLILNYQGNFINEIAIAGRQGKTLSEENIKVLTNKDCTIMQSIAINFSDNTTCWYNIKAWNNQAKVLSKYSNKGQYLGVQGAVKVNQWIDNETGEQKQMLIVDAKKLHLMSNKSQELVAA
jgi:single-strand DNA-binding protein